MTLTDTLIASATAFEERNETPCVELWVTSAMYDAIRAEPEAMQYLRCREREEVTFAGVRLVISDEGLAPT